MSDIPEQITCSECGEVVEPHTSHPSSTPEGYMLNNVEKATPKEIKLMVQCDNCNNIFKPVFTYAGNANE
jgi:ribosomal protein S27E